MGMARQNVSPKLHRKRGFTILEATVAMFTLLVCALIFAGTIPIANKSRGKAQNANVALSLAKKQLETLKHLGYANNIPSQLKASALIDSVTPVNMNTAIYYGPPGTMGYEFSNADDGVNDSAKKLLPNGRSFVRITNVNIDLKQVEVVVFWTEGSNNRFVKLSTRIANL